MKMIPIQQLKRRLSEFLAQARSGARLVITRHKKPVALLTSAELESVRVGSRFGRGKLRPALDRAATGGKYLAVLADDRRGDADGR